VGDAEWVEKGWVEKGSQFMTTRTHPRTEDETAQALDGITVVAEGPPSPAEPSPDRHLTVTMADRARALLRPLWGERRLALAAAAVLAASWGAIAAWWTPRGPLTTSEALWSIALSLLVGGGAGLVMKSRWALLVAPAAFVVVLELVRIGTEGPTVDGPRFSTYGLMALVLGRGVHGLLSVLPMLLGAAVGAGVARRLDATPGGPTGTRSIATTLRRTVAVLTAVALVALSVALARPAGTDAIVDADGQLIPGSIAELTRVDINGRDLAMMIRGHSTDNPVLLFLAGGPGGSELGAMRRHLPQLEEHFTVVTWDQRGSGTSYPQLDPSGTMTLDGSIDDTLAVTDYLRDRFDQDRIYLLGQSWGSTLGVLAVQAQPEAYRAFIGTGQMVSQVATDRQFYDDTLAWARDTGRDGLVDTLTDIGSPPYDDILDYETALSYEQDVYPYDHTVNSEGEGQMSENLLVEEYSLLEQLHVLAAFLDTFALLYPQLQEIDFRATATEFDVPLFFVQGAHEADGRADLFDEWYPTVEAPEKDLTVLATSGHRPLFEQPDEFVDYMVDTVLARTGTGAGD
jgi:pimeloyl-ACP methyl ester carboxylesterase